MRAKSALLIALSGSSVSELEPPVIAAVSVPPRRGVPCACAAVAEERDDEPQAATSPPAATAVERWPHA
jgi:hypothetical protein